jgi:hypothetical protein
MIITFGGTILIFKWLFKSPTEAYLKILKRIEGYRLYLVSSFKESAGKSGVIPSSLHKHLPYAVAFGIDCREVMIRQTQAEGYSGRSHIFSIGDFSASLFKKGRKIEDFKEGR